MAKKQSTKNFGAYIDRTIKIIRHNYTRAFKKIGVDITTEQWVILDSLYENDGLSQNELASDSFKNAPTVSRIIDLLCKKGYTKRMPSKLDRRKHLIFITTEGKVLYEKTFPVVETLRKQGWENLNDQDYDDFLRIMNQVFSNFEEETD
ncbi:MAG: DNA-binding MarR family transcriptional regulator [Maribacter sp.]|jgi:DNA-binding MarR family transcriptional regulator